MANRTIDKNKSSLGRARFASSRDGAAEATQEGAGSATGPIEDTAAEQESESLALARDDDEEDLRISPTSSGALARQSSEAPARGTGVPDFIMGNVFTRFIAESYLELRKVTWPEPREAWNSSLVVIGMSVAVALLLGGADYGLNQLVHWVLVTAAKVH